jgi:hypothetical protein
MDPYTQLLTLLLTTFAGVLPGSVQNQETQQQQASQRQLSASDFAQNPSAVLGQAGNLLGLPGASGSAAGGGVGGISGMLQALIQKFTGQTTQNLSNSAWQQTQPQLAAAGLSQAPGIANEELSTALAPSIIQEQQLGSQEGTGALNSALQTEQSDLQYPFLVGSAGAGSFPSIATL